jgi:hypothetical protein
VASKIVNLNVSEANALSIVGILMHQQQHSPNTKDYEKIDVLISDLRSQLLKQGCPSKEAQEIADKRKRGINVEYPR